VDSVASNRRVPGPDGRILTRYTTERNPEKRAAPEGVIDPEVTVVSLWNGEAPLAVLSYYACHPQSYYRTGVPSPDFPGIARFIRGQTVPEALHVHFNGAGGNIGAGKYNDGAKENRMLLALRLAEECNRAFDLAYARIAPANDGSVNWMPCWSDRRMGTVQDDMAINFSPAMYREVFRPALREMAAHTEHTVLHWHDGCAHHLDALLEVDEIDLIQYGHDPNSPPFREGLANMRKIQAAGKRLFISCVEAEDVEFFIDRLDPRGLMMIINTANDAVSRRMIEKVREWTSRRLTRKDGE